LRHVPGATPRYRRRAGAVSSVRYGCAHRSPRWCRRRVMGRQSSLVATALGVTFIFGSYSATSMTRPDDRNWARSAVRQSSQGP